MTMHHKQISHLSLFELVPLEDEIKKRLSTTWDSFGLLASLLAISIVAYLTAPWPVVIFVSSIFVAVAVHVAGRRLRDVRFLKIVREAIQSSQETGDWIRRKAALIRQRQAAQAAGRLDEVERIKKEEKRLLDEAIARNSGKD